jgi:carboxynorspermidine decarboxylase
MTTPDLHNVAVPKLPADIATPAYVLDAAALARNMATADRIRREAGCKILLATKAFAFPAAFPLMRDHLDGTTASGEYEARLGREEFGKEVHVYAPAYAPGEVARLSSIADHIYFNSPDQLARYGAAARQRPGVKIGARINPGYSNATLGGALYDPCAPNSRFGTTAAEIDQLPWGEIDIFHAHSLCESLHEGSVGLIEHVAKHFAAYVRRVKTVNFGGGHFINKSGYEPAKLSSALRSCWNPAPASSSMRVISSLR